MNKMIKGFAEKYKAIRRRQEFNPDSWGIFFNPFFISRKSLFREISRCANQLSGGLVVDVGCGTKPYRDLFGADHYFGVDIVKSSDGKNPDSDVFYDGTALPFRSGSIDGLLMSQVLEHVFEPGKLLLEMNRVLKPGGRLLLTVPFLWDEHEQPHDFGRYTSFGLRYLLEESGFSILYFKRTGNYLSSLAQMFCSYIFTISEKWNPVFKTLLYSGVCSWILIVGMIAGKLAPHNDNLYLDNVALVQKVDLMEQEDANAGEL